MTPAKFDYKLKYPEFYKPSSKHPTILEIPKMKFFMIDGKGDPNISKDYKNAISTLYAVSFTLKMYYKKQPEGQDYVVPPLEGLWYMKDMEKWTMEEKRLWNWTMMIRIPDFIGEKYIQYASEQVALKKRDKAPLIDDIRVEIFDERKVVQILYFGPYDEEPPTIKRLHQYAKENNFHLRGHHHEIYLSDPRRTKPEKLKTVIRQPLEKMS
ncbi:hypothetical protein NEF87_001160 [Candidatus Lokiarchaeum ossiferum]|uniref:GyrI-like small molecule binding domain-containing protein n=1 Tax=Candidatus Lokiarchaeum ossiferum TaxID=2951803 RepID=A0ABY6HMZ4_9ARCH|nr:hypothetical protein NEF87_001160 [Candidatus Lokiarchaeum sp. B-35]